MGKTSNGIINVDKSTWCLLVCKYYFSCKGKTWTGLYNAATGKNATLEEMLKCSERVLNLERLFNAREGFDRKDDILPERLTKEPAPDGLGKGQVVNVDVMLDEFYEAMDWN